VSYEVTFSTIDGQKVSCQLGPAAGALKPSPVNFHVRQPSQKRAWTVLNDGTSGSAMPAWKNTLTPEQIRLLIPYVQQMYDKE
jgi:mono/diheme cytochrome c family protein